MSDVRTTWSTAGGDLLLQGADLATDDGLETAVALSLFTDALAGNDEVPPGARRRGWWGDAYADQEADRIGSRLWLLARDKQLPATLRKAEAYATQALQWLVDDGVASAVDVSAEWAVPGPAGVLGLTVVVTRSTQPVVRYRFEQFWTGA